MRTNNLDMDFIYEFIENQIKNNKFPVFVQISRELYEKHGIDILPGKVAKICKKICEEKGLKYKEKKPRVASQKRLASIEHFREADESGISCEEVYICRCQGFSYSMMSRIYFDLTGKLLPYEYFSAKYKKYCEQNGISASKNSNQKWNPEFTLSNMENKTHSLFFNKCQEEKRAKDSNAKKTKSVFDMNDPYKVLHRQAQEDKKEIDER